VSARTQVAMGKIEWAMWANEQALAAGLSKNMHTRIIYLILFFVCVCVCVCVCVAV